MPGDAFDPYTRYLGLDAGRRPPNYYDLLELEVFCSHHERINHAVRKQFRLIKPFQDHPEREAREAIQDVMNEIATARVVLTNPDRKEAYDVALAKELNIDRDAYLAARVAAPLPEFTLSVIAGPSLVKRRAELVEGTAFTIGSDIHCSLPLSGDRATARHCTIEFTGGDWLLRACGPDGIVQVNDIVCREFVLADGDRIDLGGYRLLFSRITEGSSYKGRLEAPPPLSMIVLKGPSISSPVFNAVGPQRIVIGHGDTALWRLPDQKISRHHCAVQAIGDRWELEDLAGTTGTKVNGVEVLRHILNDRDVVAVGPFDIMISLRC